MARHCVAKIALRHRDKLIKYSGWTGSQCLIRKSRIEPTLNKFLSSAAAGSFMLTASTAFAGGPVIGEDEMDVVAEKPASSAGLLPLLLIPIILCVAL